MPSALTAPVDFSREIQPILEENCWHCHGPDEQESGLRLDKRAAVLAGGISEALITTAAGLVVAIPSLIGYRYLRGRVDTLVVRMEKEAITLVEALHRKRYLDALGQSDESAEH